MVHAGRGAVALVLAASLAVAGPAAGLHWGSFGGDPGRSGHQPVGGGRPPVEGLWQAPTTPDILTPVLVSDGPGGTERVIYGTGDARTPEGDVVGGRIHVRTLAAGLPVTPPEGIKVSDEPDAFGDGFGATGFVETSSSDALGQIWAVFNDVNGVSIAQVDEVTGELVQKRLPDPTDVNDKLVGITVNSSALLSPPDAKGTRALFFVGFGDVTPVETLYKVTILRAGTRQAEITAITTTNGDFNLVDFASPSLVWLTANASNNEAHVVVGDCRGKLYTFAVDDLAPGPIGAVGAATDCVLTASAPVTPTGAVPGAAGSGLVRTPVMYVATIDPEGTSTRVHRLIQETSISFRRQPDDPPVLPGAAANAVAVDAVITPSGTLAAGGRVYVATGRNLFVLDARDLTNIVARFDPDDGLVPGDTGFSQSAPVVNGELLFVTRDNGEQLVLDKRTLAPVVPSAFSPPETARPEPGSFSFGQAALSGRTLVYGTSRGAFAYRLRAPEPPAGYWLAGADGAVFAFGDAGFFGSAGGTPLASPVVAISPTPGSTGYRLLTRDGDVLGYGDAGVAGTGTGSGRRFVGLATTPTGGGYWLAAEDGSVLAGGDAPALGDALGLSQGPIVGITATPTGRGYWLVARDGGVFSYGDARFFGSAAGKSGRPVAGLAATPAGNGYWLVAADGGVFAFGAAVFAGSAAGATLAGPVVGLAGGASGNGYTLAGADGGVFTYGGHRFAGSTGDMDLNAPVVAIATTG